MAERRMFAKTIIDSDAFIDMPMSARLLYYDLAMRADDDGFVNSPKKIMRMIGVSDDDFKVLVTKKFIIPFESGIVVIKHWKVHNYIAKDRYTETKYKEEKATLLLDENNSYTNCIQPVHNLETQVRLGKVRLGKDNIESKETKHTYGVYKHVKLTDSELEKLKAEYSNADELITFLDEYIEMKGYKAKSHYLAIRKWVKDAVKEKKPSDVKNKFNDNQLGNLSHFYTN